MADLADLAQEVIGCGRCPRLHSYGAEVARLRRRAYAGEEYWARPVPGFGDPAARILLVGLAPAAHGAHRTGRMFTGDRSGDFLYASLYRLGLATQAESRSREDGLRLRGVYITSSLHCAPPGNRPRPEELNQCRPFLEREIGLLRRLRVIVALGRLGHEQTLRVLQNLGHIERRSAFPFGHGIEYRVGPLFLLGCYHPSQQNTFTGVLTATMLDTVLRRAGQISS